MGMAVHPDGKRLAIACKQNVQTFANAPELAANYPKNPGTYDALFLPRATYHTGPMDWHDLAWTDDGLLGVNTLFSCIARIDDSHHFTPVWTPPTVSEWVGEDRCHLNGLAVRDGEVAYATAFNRGNSESREVRGTSSPQYQSRTRKRPEVSSHPPRNTGK